jgi:GTPase SAR1 family protein
MNEELNNILKIKIIIVGDSGVGKSNIRSRLCQNKFEIFSNKTVGVQYSQRKFLVPLENKLQTVAVNFWDVAG